MEDAQLRLERASLPLFQGGSGKGHPEKKLQISGGLVVGEQEIPEGSVTEWGG